MSEKREKKKKIYKSIPFLGAQKYAVINKQKHDWMWFYPRLFGNYNI